ncbi:hypothetical protein JCM10908_004696 [Rhodotorula pacifica]|uniref:uncharacterized protein n=1 Tax=Rhodotorula pacifica TaxID=1495444 RepID=UPI003181326E
MQPFQSYSYDGGGSYDPTESHHVSYSQSASEHPSPQTSDFYADSYFEDSVASLAPAAYPVDPIESAYGPQAVSAGSPSAYAGSVDHNMVDAEVDMLQASGLSGFDAPGGASSSLASYAMDPPAAAVPPRSYSYAGTSGSPANIFGSNSSRRDGGGGTTMSNAFAASSRQGGAGSSTSTSQDAFARLRAGSMSIAPSAAAGGGGLGQQRQQQQQQQQQPQYSQHQYQHQQQLVSQHQSQLQQQQQQLQQQQRSVANPDRVRMLASMRTASSPVLSVSPGATFQSSPSRPTFTRPQSQHGSSSMAGMMSDTQAQVAPSTYQPYPSYSLSNPVYDLYGSSYGNAQNANAPLAYSHQSPQAPPLAVNQKPFSHNPSQPSDPYDHKALGLPSPPPRTNDGAKTTNQHKNIYSGSGFDLVGILARVVNRRNPTIEIGAVDMSCSFVVVDARKFDTPIVYASETFARLTGYETEEIVGRNCRFLQAPGDQAVVQGDKRRYTDGNAAYHLRKHIEQGEETQVSLINYHKGGKPFINLVTCVPVSMDDSGQVSFFVGFQVDLVDQPAAILDKMQNGSYVVNYSVVHATIARNPSVISFDPVVNMEAIEESAQQAQQNPTQVSQAVARIEASASTLQQAREQVRTDEPGELIDTVAAQGAHALVNDSIKRQFMRLMVDESDDLIHVLSLKGALLYVSGASRRLLEYEPSELLGKTLSSFCHPSDIVSVQRELKDAGVAVHPTVNLVYRIRRKNSGYVWFEAQGRLHLEAGKGRKCVILSGRPREVPKMSWRDLEDEGGVGEGADEFWAKVCVDGIFLSATQSAQKMLGVSDVDKTLLGKGIADLSRTGSEDAERFMAALRKASRGEPSKVSHAIYPKAGASAVNVVTRFYPARSSTDSMSKENAPAPPNMQPIGGSQVTVIAQVSLATRETARSSRRRLSSSTIANSASVHLSQSGSATSSVPPSLDMSSSTAVTTACASSAGVPCPTSVVATAVPGTGPPGLTSFSALPSTFKALTTSSTASDNVFDELNVTRGTSWQFELHQMRLTNKKLREEREALEAIKKRKEQLAKAPPPNKAGPTQRACANCGRTSSAEWRSGPTGPKTLCNACGLRWSKARSQAAQAEKKRQEAGDVKPSEAAMAQATSSESASQQSRSGSRESSGSGTHSTAPTTTLGSPLYSGQQQQQHQQRSPHSPDSIPYASPLGLAPNNISPIALYQSMSIAPEVRTIRPPLIHHPTSKLQHGFVASASPGPPASLSLLPDARSMHPSSNAPT